MANNLTSLRAWIQAIAGAIASAQQEVERQHILSIGNLFDKQMRPLMMLLRLPSLRSGAAPGEEEILRVPMLTLLAHNPLRISEAEVEFDIALGSLEDDGELAKPESVRAMAEGESEGAAPRVRRILTNAYNGANSARGPKAHVMIRVRDAEVPEGLARLLAELNKMHGASPAPPLPAEQN